MVSAGYYSDGANAFDMIETHLLLQPLAGDWRQRVKAAQRRERASEPVGSGAGKPARAAAAAAAPGGAGAAAPDLAALSAGLPPGWKAVLDKASGDVYYGNPATKVGESGPAPRNLAGRTSARGGGWVHRTQGTNGRLAVLLAACGADMLP